MPSSTVENYIKRIYLEEQSHPRDLVAMGHLATAMGVTPGTATAMIKTLDEARLVHYEPREGVRLTPGGKKLALHVLRRHRLVELLLVELLGLDWSEVHEEAEALEHVISDRVLERIDEVLGHPAVDPHGDPIPSPEGTVSHPEMEGLSDCPIGQPVQIARVLDQDPDFLQFLDRSGLLPGKVVRITGRNKAADVVDVSVGRKRKLSLGQSSAAKILVTTI